MCIYALIWPNDDVNIKGVYTASASKYIYNIIDIILCIPLLYVVIWKVGFVYLIDYKMIGFGGAVTTGLNALTSIMGNQREFLSILALNRIRAFYEASKGKEGPGELLALHNNHRALKWFFFGFAGIIFISWLPRF